MKFIDDGIWYVCANARVRKLSNGKNEAKWPSDSKWYEVEIHACGGKFYTFFISKLLQFMAWF